MDIRELPTGQNGDPAQLNDSQLAAVSGGTEGTAAYVFSAHEVIYMTPDKDVFLKVEEDVCTDDPDYSVRCTRHDTHSQWDILITIDFVYESAKRLDLLRSRNN